MAGIGLVFLYICISTALSLVYLIAFIKTKKTVYPKIICVLWLPVALLGALIAYHNYPIDKDRIVGVYSIDTNFYPGKNAEWQREHFSFEITESDDFVFREKLKDGSLKEVYGKIIWMRESSPRLFTIELEVSHPLIDTTPTLYRGNRKFYYVFDSKFGNMFYRKKSS